MVEYPWKAKTLSERIGTALINGNWFVRKLKPLARRAILMHGHRHVDWIGQCARPHHRVGALPGHGGDRRGRKGLLHPHAGDRPTAKLKLLAPEWIEVPGEKPLNAEN